MANRFNIAKGNNNPSQATSYTQHRCRNIVYRVYRIAKFRQFRKLAHATANVHTNVRQYRGHTASRGGTRKQWSFKCQKNIPINAHIKVFDRLALVIARPWQRTTEDCQDRTRTLHEKKKPISNVQRLVERNRFMAHLIRPNLTRNPLKDVNIYSRLSMEKINE